MISAEKLRDMANHVRDLSTHETKRLLNDAAKTIEDLLKENGTFSKPEGRR